MKSKWMLGLLATVMLLVAGVTGGKVLATPAAGQMTTTLANATVGDLDLRGQALVTTVGADGKPHPSGVWLAWLKTHGRVGICMWSTTSSRRAGRAAGTRTPAPA